MAGNISEFLQNFGEGARPSRFEVIISPFDVYGGNSLTNLRYVCENAQLPGRNFLTVDQKTYGPVQKFPYQTDYSDVSLTFVVDEPMTVKAFFDDWMDLINPSLNGTSRYFNMSYKENYSTKITITQFDNQNKPSYRISLIKAFPINMNQLDLDWSSEGLHKLVVTFAYDYWQTEDIPPNEIIDNTEQAPT